MLLDAVFFNQCEIWAYKYFSILPWILLQNIFRALPSNINLNGNSMKNNAD